MNRYVLIILVLTIGLKAYGQLIESDPEHRANDEIRILPSFTMHKDNYFITGIPLNAAPSKDNADVKYQISFKQRLRKTPLPGQFYPFLLYSQKAFWDIYKNSKPFGEINFNPGLALVRPFFIKGHRLAYITFSLEHESNGRDSTYSRSWNFMAISLKSNLNDRWRAGIRFWLPFSYRDDNRDLMHYIGYGELSASYVIKTDKWSADILLRKGAGWKGTLQAQLNFNPFKGENQFLMLQWYQGYGESLIDYERHTSMLRLGFVLKADQLSIF